MQQKFLSGVNLLLVEDEPDLMEVIVEELEPYGPNIFQATNGHRAFDLLQANHIDAIVSDIRMPGGDGIELLERVRARDPEEPIFLFFTAFTDMSIETAIEKGARGLLYKPVSGAAIAHTLADLMNIRR